MGWDPTNPGATYPPGPHCPALRRPPAFCDRTDNLLTRQYEQPGPLSGLAFGKPSGRSKELKSLDFCFCTCVFPSWPLSLCNATKESGFCTPFQRRGSHVT